MSIVYFDLETGGLLPENPDIQLAAVAIGDQGNEIGSFEHKIFFDEKLCDPEALKINHYDRKVWESEGAAHGAVMGRFAKFLQEHASIQMFSKRTGQPYYIAQLAGYNALTFDGPRLRAGFERWNLFLPAHPRVMCVLDRAAWWFHEHPGAERPKSMKLGDVCAAFGIEIPDAHDALADVRATATLAKALAVHLAPAVAA